MISISCTLASFDCSSNSPFSLVSSDSFSDKARSALLAAALSSMRSASPWCWIAVNSILYPFRACCKRLDLSLGRDDLVLLHIGERRLLVQLTIQLGELRFLFG